MKCPSCGADIEQDAKFCTNCGKGIDTVSQPAQAPATQPVQQTPVATYVNTGQAQPQKKKSNVVLIVVLVILGVFIVGILGIVLLVRMFFKNVISEIEDYDPGYSDIYDDDDDEYGEVIKKVKDPTGHEIKIITDEYTILEVDTSYLYDKEKDMITDQDLAKLSDIDKLSATDKEKAATKKVIKDQDSLLFSSKRTLKDHLIEEGYSDSEINFALENSGIDWKEHATIYAYKYLASGGFSKEGLIKQLQYEQYTTEESKYAAENKDLDYYEQALYDAIYYRYGMSKYSTGYTRDQAKRMLEYDKYTTEEIDFALKTAYDELDYQAS